MFQYQGKKINIDQQLTVGDTTYPSLRDPAVREMLGITEVPDPIYPDPDLFYWSQNEDGTLNITPKSDEQIAQQTQSKLNQTSLAYLAETDWIETKISGQFARGLDVTTLLKKYAEELNLRDEARLAIVKLVQP